MTEFELIRTYFAGLTPPRRDVSLGPGDDAALVQAPPGHEIVVTTDTLVAGHHFPEATEPQHLGWKALAVSLSDIAAMGAEPAWMTLSLTLPDADASWLRGFSAGIKALAEPYGVTLVGGDLTRGPLAVTTTVMGLVQAGTAVKRQGAQVGDLVCVTGTLGDAALALRMLMLDDLDGPKRKFFRRRADPKPLLEPGFQLREAPTRDDRSQLCARLDQPDPRVEAGRILGPDAHAMIDLSDGLAGDLPHLFGPEAPGAEIWVDRLPASPEFQRLAPPAYAVQLQASGGDDFELCVCVPSDRLNGLRRKLPCPLSMVGRIIDTEGLHWVTGDGTLLSIKLQGYQHFQ